MLRKKQKGQGLTEFALILPILLLFLLGIIEGGRIVYAFITIQNAAREATRYAVTGRPFACPNDPVDPGGGAPGSGDKYDLNHFCDDPIQGDPWSPQVPSETRVKAIKNEAMKSARGGLNIKYFAVEDANDFDINRDKRGAFGVNVYGQDAANQQGAPDYAGQPGWNVSVRVYYNIEMLDPIYGAIADYVHLNGLTELENEGIDPDAVGYQGGIVYQPDNCAPNCGGFSPPFLLIQDELGDFSEPQGGKFTASVNDHQPNTAYKVWFVHKDNLFSDSLDFTTDNLGGRLVNFVISASAPPSEWDYKIYTTLASDTTPVASCNGDLPINAPCFKVETGNASIEVRNVTQGDELQQPLATARWPISSSIPIYIFGHNVSEDYTIKFDGLISTLAPGTLTYNGSIVTDIPTDSQFGTNDGNIPAYYIATGHIPGNMLVSSEDMAGTEVASTTLEFITAGIDVNAPAFPLGHPAGDIVFIVLRNHAPFQQYRIFFDDGITPPATIRADASGELSLNYFVPDGVHEPSPTDDPTNPNFNPPVPVEIYTMDYGRGSNLNKIASRTIPIFTPKNPYINVPGGARWPPGSPILIQVRRHTPNTDYGIYLQQGSTSSPTFSELINDAIITTNGLGAYDMYYTIPISYSGFYVIRTFEPSAPTTEVAAFNIEFTGNPYLTIDDGKRWPPGSKITIRLKNHVPGTSYDVWLDKGGPQETFLGPVLTDAFGEGTVAYTIPQTMPYNTSPGYPIQSYLGSALIAEIYLEVEPADLMVTKIDLPKVTFDIEVPITLTVYNDSPVTVTNTYFDTDIYVDPPAAPLSTDNGLPPGSNKNWLDFVPPYGSVLVEDDIVLFGQQSHDIYARADTTNWVAEDDETNNVAFKSIDAVCPVEISDEFPGDGLTEWSQTDFGDSGPGSSQTESSGTLIMTNNGSGALSADDSGSGAGYHFMHQTVGSGPFEVYVRVDQAPPSGSNGLAGLEIRGDHLDGSSKKIMFVHRASNQLTLYRRASGFSAVNKKTESSVSAPVWLKISRNGDVFEFYRVAGASDTPPANWGNVWHTLTGFSMPDSVEVGLINAPSSSSPKEAHFKHFHVCAASAPGGGYLGNQCGQVEENGNGQVVIDAVNTIINQSGAGHTWKPVTVDNVLGELSMGGLEADPDSGADLAAGAGPHATYQVNVQSAGTYYAWVAGWGPDGSGNSVHVGLNGTAAVTIDGFPTGGSAPGWEEPMSGSLSINTGINTIDLWVKEDGARVFKILLTQDAGFSPSPDGMAQSACTIIAQPHVPPLMDKCVNPIRKGDFEGTLTDVANEWTTENLANFYSVISYDSNQGGEFPAFANNEPSMFQTFEIPDLSPLGVLPDTRAVLKLNLGVDLNGSSTPADKFYFTLRRASDGFELIPPVLMADGQDRTTDVPPIPDLDPASYTVDQWVEFNQNVLSGVNPVNVLNPGESVRAYFYVSDPGIDTGFHVDNISLSFCSTQPIPDPVPGTGKVSGVAQVGGTPTGGVNVWAYAYSDGGSTPGPVFQTYSLTDGSYRFYNLPPGTYLIYAEVQTAQGTFFASRLIVVTAGGNVTNLVLNVDTA